MSKEYAIQQIIPKDGRSMDESHLWNSDVVYHPVPQAVAETDENGVFRLINYYDHPVTPWVPLQGAAAERTKKAIEKAKNTGLAQNDIMGEELAVGDYVAMSYQETADQFIGQVVSFTPKKVRVRTFNWYPDVVAKNASGLVKIQPHILFD